jgi:hypothetical protein
MLQTTSKLARHRPDRDPPLSALCRNARERRPSPEGRDGVISSLSNVRHSQLAADDPEFCISVDQHHLEHHDARIPELEFD